MKKPNVLMLGWEFPPQMSGGLGVAFLGISRALAPKVNLTIIVPKHDEKVRIKGAELIGIGNLDIDSFFKEEEIKKLEKVIKNRQIQIELSPYPTHSISEKIYEETTVKEKKKIPGKLHQLHHHFKDADLYGKSVVDMIMYYAEISEIIASKI
jgi:hypothetical protein